MEDCVSYFVSKNGIYVHNDGTCQQPRKSRPKKGKKFRGGSKKKRDNWYGKMIKHFKNGGKEKEKKNGEEVT